MISGLVKVMGAGVVVMLCVEEVRIMHTTLLANWPLIIVSCPTLTSPYNGIISCLLGGDGVPSYEDTCSFTCNTGYELTGSDTRTCQNNGSWSDSDVVCRKGKINAWLLAMHVCWVHVLCILCVVIVLVTVFS